ncbi:hypothetical protein BJF78_02145 [Pseudonocardia sp. CNS-139]|nr:hypothetical protein BJF78_02145 [Pseudonocardia sp. CNS-139]
MARRNRATAATADDPTSSGALALDPPSGPLPMTGPHDGDELDPEVTEAVGLVDFGAVQLPVPPGGKVTVEPTANGRMQAVHITLGGGRLSVSALAAPKSSKLWPDLCREIDKSLRDGGARVRSYSGEWGRELHATSGKAKSVFVGVDGARWMLYGVATGPADRAETLEAELRRMLRGTVVVRGRKPYPVRTVLPLTVPEHLAEEIAAAEAAKKPAVTAQAAATTAQPAVQPAAQPAARPAADPAGGTQRIALPPRPRPPPRPPRSRCRRPPRSGSSRRPPAGGGRRLAGPAAEPGDAPARRLRAAAAAVVGPEPARRRRPTEVWQASRRSATDIRSRRPTVPERNGHPQPPPNGAEPAGQRSGAFAPAEAPPGPNGVRPRPHPGVGSPDGTGAHALDQGHVADGARPGPRPRPGTDQRSGAYALDDGPAQDAPRPGPRPRPGGPASEDSAGQRSRVRPRRRSATRRSTAGVRGGRRPVVGRVRVGQRPGARRSAPRPAPPSRRAGARGLRGPALRCVRPGRRAGGRTARRRAGRCPVTPRVSAPVPSPWTTALGSTVVGPTVRGPAGRCPRMPPTGGRVRSPWTTVRRSAAGGPVRGPTAGDPAGQRSGAYALDQGPGRPPNGAPGAEHSGDLAFGQGSSGATGPDQPRPGGRRHLPDPAATNGHAPDAGPEATGRRHLAEVPQPEQRPGRGRPADPGDEHPSGRHLLPAGPPTGGYPAPAADPPAEQPSGRHLLPDTGVGRAESTGRHLAAGPGVESTGRRFRDEPELPETAAWPVVPADGVESTGAGTCARRPPRSRPSRHGRAPSPA